MERKKSRNTQRIQRGANRPFGKRPKKSQPESLRKFTAATGSVQAGWAYSSAVVGPDVCAVTVTTRARAPNSATQSSERRQKITSPTATQITETATVRKMI